MPDAPLVATGVAAEAIGIAHSTLSRWWKDGYVTPTVVTPGGHARWDIDDLREQLRARRRERADGDQIHPNE
jgi:predicted site-specific integrase-resolvase